LFGFVARSDSITAERIKASASNRLEWKNEGWEYTTGQLLPHGISEGGLLVALCHLVELVSGGLPMRNEGEDSSISQAEL